MAEFRFLNKATAEATEVSFDILLGNFEAFPLLWRERILRTARTRDRQQEALRIASLAGLPQEPQHG